MALSEVALQRGRVRVEPMDFPEGIIRAAKNAQEIKIEEGSVAWRVGGAFSQCLELQGEGRRQGSETREEKKKEKLGLL